MKLFLFLFLSTVVVPVYGQNQDSLVLFPAYQVVEDNALLESALNARSLSEMNRYVINGKSVSENIFLKVLDTIGDFSFIIQLDSIKNEKVIILKKNRLNRD